MQWLKIFVVTSQVEAFFRARKSTLAPLSSSREHVSRCLNAYGKEILIVIPMQSENVHSGTD
jgi:hypothetical protein